MWHFRASTFILGCVTMFGALDQWTKYLARTSPEWGGAFWSVKKVFFLNTGIAFSIPFPPWAYWLCVIGVGVGAVWLFKRHVTLFRISAYNQNDVMQHIIRGALWGILFGGLSNMIDRVRFGGVIDPFEILGGLTFNVADGMIVVGICMLFMWGLSTKKLCMRRSISH